MYIEPNSSFYILKNCPLDTSFDHSIWFSSQAEQYAYFNSLAKYRLTKQSYQRANSGAMRVNILSDNLYDCNYIMFQNTSFGNKWFYAYITAVNYINNETSEITYIIDPLQTWLFNFKFEDCFIEREHTSSDRIGEHLVPEGLETGEYVCTGLVYRKGWDEQVINIITTFGVENDFTPNFKTSECGMYSGIFSGLTIYSFNLNNSISMNYCAKFLKDITDAGRSDGIVGLFMCPKFMVTEKVDGHDKLAINSKPNSYMVTINKPYSNIDGYVPKNNKLFTSPYIGLVVTNGEGDAHTYSYEYFGQDGFSEDCNFTEYYSYNPSPEATTAPFRYKRNFYVGGKDGYNWEERLNMSGFPFCAYAVDAYRAWLAQKKATLPYETAQMALGAITTMLGANAIGGGLSNAPAFSGSGGSASSFTGLVPQFQYNNVAGWGNVGGMVGAGAGVAPVAAMACALGAIRVAGSVGNFVLDQLKQKSLASIQPPKMNGSISGSGLSTACGVKRFTYYQMSIRAEFAKQIDNFFSVFGYKTNRLGKPNPYARPHWNYIKTTNCVIKSSMPADDAEAICALFNRGITLWRKGSEVGNYSLDNRPKG